MYCLDLQEAAGASKSWYLVTPHCKDVTADHNITCELGTVNPRYSGLIEGEIVRINKAKDSLKEQKNLEKKYKWKIE
jgi:hypothetical protein